jgi:hypothetical protein
MKKPIVASIIIALMLLLWGFFAPAQSQDSTREEKPTFYRLTPGVYVNGWPRFTVTYPKDWVEETPQPQEVFRAGNPPHGVMLVNVFPYPLPLDKYADYSLPFWRTIAKDVTVVSDKSSRLRDGTPAWEVEFQMVMNGLPLNFCTLATKKGDTLIGVGVGSLRGRIREDLKAILYSLEFQPDKDKPVKVSPDIQELLDSQCSNMVAHDFAKVMANYSDRYLNSGRTKGERERFYRQVFGSITSFEMVITDFVAAGEKAYLTGFVITNLGTIPITDTSIIKENDEWKWYGNQRDVVP